MFFDVHTHNKNSLNGIINIFPSEINSVEKTRKYSIGLHPWYIKEDYRKQIEITEENANISNIIAIGEIGLDKKCKTPYDIQIDSFTLQLDIAEKYKKPAIIHCVKSYNEVINIRRSYKTPFIIHGFSGNFNIAKQLIQNDIYLSFGKNLLTENSKVIEAFKLIPLDKIFFETDIAQVSIEDIYLAASKIKNINMEDMVSAVHLNYKKVFITT